MPHGVPAAFDASESLNDQSPKALTSQIFEPMSTLNRINLSHDDTSDVRMVRTAMQLQLRGCSHYSTPGNWR